MTEKLHVMPEQQSTPKGLACGLSACLALFVMLTSHAARADTYASLSDTDKAYVKRVCESAQYEQGATVYRNCIEQHSQAIEKSYRTPVASLDFDEQLSVQQTCQKQGAIGSVDYRQCVVEEARSLNGVQPTDISSLNNDDIYTARQDCAESQARVRGYRLCLNAVVAELKGPSIAKTEVPTVAKAIVLTPIKPASRNLDREDPDRIATNKLIASTLLSKDLIIVSPNKVESTFTTLTSEMTTADTEVTPVSPTVIVSADVVATELVPAVLPSTELASTEFTSTEVAPVELAYTERAPTDVTTTDISTELSSTETAVEVPSVVLLTTYTPSSADIEISKPAADKLPENDLAFAELASANVVSDANNSLAISAVSDEMQNSAEQTFIVPANADAIRVNTSLISTLDDRTSNVVVAANEPQLAEPALQSALFVETPTPQPSATDATSTNSQTAAPADQQQDDVTTDTDTPSATKQPLDAAKEFVQKLWDQLLASLDGATGINRIILLAALALPFLLIGFWLFMRRSTGNSNSSDNSESYNKPIYEGSSDSRINSHLNSPMDDTADVQNDMLSTQQLHLADQVEELFTDDQFAQSAANTFVDDSPPTQQEPETSVISEEIAAPAPAKKMPSSNLSALLENHEKDEQLGFVIEFMIYWMAFTDERYEPELKRNIFAEKNPDDHDLIKRYVLSRDFESFTYATSWLQSQAIIGEREQVLKLLMALLVYEEGITPVQNTMLRFLANAFGFTHNQLDDLFKTAYGHPLPSMPRPDKPTWWNKQSSDKLKRWDARSVARQSQSIQARVKLGLPLSGELNRKQVVEPHARAISRCQVENFSLLSNREQQLAERQQGKFNSAFEALMEISE